MTMKSLIGNWQSPKGNIWIIRKSLDRSNKYLDVEFRVMTKYQEPFGFLSDCFEPERWNRMDSESLEKHVQERQLIKEAAN